MVQYQTRNTLLVISYCTTQKYIVEHFAAGLYKQCQYCKFHSESENQVFFKYSVTNALNDFWQFMDRQMIS